MKVLIDTNILIDYFAQRNDFYDDTLKLKAAAVFGDIDIWATSNSLTDVFYILRKSHGSSIIQEMFLNAKELLNICSVTSEDIFATAEKKWPDFEDCLMYRCAEKIKADYLLTRDREGFFGANTPCLSPSEFFVMLEKEVGISYQDIS